MQNKHEFRLEMQQCKILLMTVQTANWSLESFDNIKSGERWASKNISFSTQLAAFHLNNISTSSSFLHNFPCFYVTTCTHHINWYFPPLPLDISLHSLYSVAQISCFPCSVLSSRAHWRARKSLFCSCSTTWQSHTDRKKWKVIKFKFQW